jgi:tetratricopeptide (TPR) repeat protein
MNQQNTAAAERFDEAVAAHQQGDLPVAIAGYRAVVAFDPTHKLAFNNLGTALKAQGQLEDAIKAYEQAIALDAGYASAIYNLGTAHHVAGNLKDAYIHYLRADGLQPDNANTLYNLGLIAELARVFDYAADLFRRVLVLSPDSRRAQTALARCLRDIGRFDEAMAVMETVLAAAPDDAASWCIAGQICLGAHDWARAADHLQRAVALSPDAVDARMDLALAWLELGRYEEVLALSDHLISQIPDYGSGHVMRARALEGLGRPMEAQAAEAVGRSLPGSALAWVVDSLCLPFVPADRAHIRHLHERYYECMDNADRFGSLVRDPAREMSRTPFYLAYHGHDMLPMMQRLSQTMLRMSPELSWVAPHCRPTGVDAQTG